MSDPTTKCASGQHAPTRANDSRTVADARPRSEVPLSTADIREHELIRRIGQGAYGEVWLARNVMGTYRAVKIVYRASFDRAGRFGCLIIDLRNSGFMFSAFP